MTRPAIPAIFPLALPLALCCLLFTSCSSVYYEALETVGIEKRQILVDRIDDTRDAQEEAKEQFTTALERYRSVVKVEGGDLEEIYDRLNTDYERSVTRADEVRERIDAVEPVAEDLFDEWENEIESYANPDLARQSRELLGDTRAEYAELMRAMRRAEKSMDPVLELFNDQVMFLRHNLNARAIGALENELAAIEQATVELIREMEDSIAEAGKFIDSMK